jgi:hypothetical protein
MADDAAAVAAVAAPLRAESRAGAAVQRPRSPSRRRRQDSPPVSVDTSVAIWDGNASENRYKEE